MPEGYPVPRHTPLETETIQGEPCRFRTCYPVTLWPIEVESASLARPPLTAPLSPRSAQAAAVLRLVLHCRAEGAAFNSLPIESLRFFLKGQPQHVNLLYELIFNHALEVALAGSPRDPEAVILGPEACLRQVGFERDEGLLPYSPRSFVGYRLLTEFFAFPDKFLFVDLVGLAGRLPTRARNRLEVFVYLDRAVPDLEQHVSADVFRLGCTPVVNLYRQRAEPIQLTHTDYEYRVTPERAGPWPMRSIRSIGSSLRPRTARRWSTSPSIPSSTVHASRGKPSGTQPGGRRNKFRGGATAARRCICRWSI